MIILEGMKMLELLDLYSELLKKSNADETLAIIEKINAIRKDLTGIDKRMEAVAAQAEWTLAGFY